MIDHGGDIYSLMDETGLPEGEIIDFSASINPLGPPESVVNEIKKQLKNLIHYPDPDAKRLRLKLGNIFNISPESIICGNGCTELIYLIARTMRFKKILIPAPTFGEYEKACRIANPESVLIYYDLKKTEDFDINHVSFINTIIKNKADAVFLCNPNNPTGRLIKREDMLEIAEAATRQKVYLIVDESFIDFCPDGSVIDAVKNNPYLVVLRSMTKIYALAGLRLGYGILPLGLVEAIKKQKEPWSVNMLAQIAGVAALEDSHYKSRSMRIIKQNKVILENGFTRLGIDYTPTAANYYLLNSLHGKKIAEMLRLKNIIVRDCSNFRGLDDTYIRVAVSSKKHIKMLLKYLKDYFDRTKDFSYTINL